MGIGGAIMNVPILKFVGYTINKAIGTAASIGFLISIFGTIGFLSTGIMMQKNIPLSTGFINIPAFLIFIPITIIMAKIGATAVHKMKRDIIAKLFGFFLIITPFIHRIETPKSLPLGISEVYLGGGKAIPTPNVQKEII